MKPENLINIGDVIGSRLADEGRADMLREVDSAQRDMIHAAERARDDIRDLYRMGTSKDTKIVVLENRQINDKNYSIVGKISLGRKNDGPVENAMVHLGVAFDNPVGLSEAAEEELGEGLDGRVWYGGWVNEESTYGVEKAKEVLDTGVEHDTGDELQPGQLSTYHEKAMKMLSSMQETLEVLVAAAKDPSLNPVADDDIPS